MRKVKELEMKDIEITRLVRTGLDVYDSVCSVLEHYAGYASARRKRKGYFRFLSRLGMKLRKKRRS